MLTLRAETCSLFIEITSTTTKAGSIQPVEKVILWGHPWTLFGHDLSRFDMTTKFRQKERWRSLTGDANDLLCSEDSLIAFLHYYLNNKRLLLDVIETLTQKEGFIDMSHCEWVYLLLKN